MLFQRKLLYIVSYYSEVLSEYEKNLGVWKTSEVWKGRSLIVPLDITCKSHNTDAISIAVAAARS